MIRLYTRFYKLVRTDGKWDLKAQWDTRSISISKQIQYHNKKMDYDDPGNLHFGFVGCVLFSKTVLVAGAGIYQIKTDYNSLKAIKKRVRKLARAKKKKNIVLKRLKSFGDDPKDSKFIRQGFNKGVKYKRRVIDKWMKKDVISFVPQL